MNDGQTDVSRESILVVDDTPGNLRLISGILSERGYNVRPVTNGKLALWGARGTTPPDLILLDIMMPEMDGYEVCKRLKADERARDIPVIFLSALDDVRDKVKAFQVGGVDYITKPFQEEEVLARVETHLSLRRMRWRLEEQNRELIEAARLREDVGRITRHDLKSPLNAIIGLPQAIMTDDTLSAQHLTYLERIEEAGLTMLNMINLSLDMFRMERKMYPFEPAPVDVRRLIRKIVNDAKLSAMSKKLTVTTNINGKPADIEDVFAVRGEELLCYSMLANLIKNAFEASSKGARITIELSDEEEMSVISIHNMGAAPESIRDRFFDKYVTSGKKTGTGLGTYSARLIAETQGGSIHLDTSEEKGTTVTVRLATPTPEDKRKMAARADVSAPPSESPAESGMMDRSVLESDRLNALPEEWLAALMNAAQRTDPNGSNAAIDRIRERDEPLADALAGLVEGYRFDIIQELLEGRGVNGESTRGNG